ncbi:MAG TPA: ferritin-like domain-containing protein [Gemmatimonas sp.]|uniref:ferritin-like domain-containing protein n=1 Tax=Gemmatimonas sp. TaxID=1962908 RepID=UPI002ED91585
MAQRPAMHIADAGLLATPRTRRDMLRLMALGGTAVFLPSMLAACSDDNDGMTGPTPGGGNTLTIDFSKGDIAVLQFAYALEQLEADFYTRVVDRFSSSNIPTAERTLLTDIRNHEIAHREFLKAALGATNGFTLTATYPNINFEDRTSVLNAARTFEDLGVAAYNGAGQYLTNAANLTIAGKIVSVEARHASAIRDLISPKTNAFSPSAFDDVFSPGKVAAAAQGFVVDKLAFANAPTAFVQGPNNNG